MSKTYVWRDKMGYCHNIPEGSCVICEHCTDIFIDPFQENEIYNCWCDHKDNTECSRECDDFVLKLDGVENIIEDEGKVDGNRDKIKSIIIKSLETAKDFELVEAYAQLVSCGDCPYWKDCKNESYCDVYIADKLKEGE